jgi:hypothetical protein
VRVIDDHWLVIPDALGNRRLDGLQRSGLWRVETWPRGEELPSAAEILNDHIGIGDLAACAARLADSYTNRI